eukprot:scaffold940_cov569-Prasinococcus_capsulatus_cf.AAC.14
MSSGSITLFRAGVASVALSRVGPKRMKSKVTALIVVDAPAAKIALLDDRKPCRGTGCPHLDSQPSRREQGVSGHLHLPLCFKPSACGSISCRVNEPDTSSIRSSECSGTLKDAFQA